MEFRLTRNFKSKKSDDEAFSFLLVSETLAEFEQFFSDNTQPAIFEYYRDQDYKLTLAKMEWVNDFFLTLSFENKILLCSLGINLITLDLIKENCDVKLSFNTNIKTILDHKHKDMFYRNIKHIGKHFIDQVVWDQESDFMNLSFKYKNERYV